MKNIDAERLAIIASIIFTILALVWWAWYLFTNSSEITIN